MAKFDNVRVNNTVYHLLCGKGTVTKVHNLGCIKRYFSVKFKTCENDFDFDGYLINEKFEREEKIVTLYWNEIKLPTEEEDKKPFDLVEFLKENLSKQEFINERINYCLFKSDIWCCDTIDKLYPGVVYLQGAFKGVIDILNQNNISVEQLVEAYKELGWL